MKLQKIIALSSLFICSLALAKVQQIDRIVAIINTDIIMLSELQRAEKNYQQKQELLPAAKTYRLRVLERLILNKIKDNFLSNNNAEITSSIVDNAITQIAQNNKLTVDQLISQLSSEGMKIEDLRVKIKTDIEKSQLRQLLIPSKVIINKIALQREVAKLPKSVILGQSPKYYHVGHILITESKALAQSVAKQLRRGKSFSQLAKRYSQAPTAATGGDLGWRKKHEFPDLIAAMLKGSGSVKGPTIVASGWHIIKILETSGGTVRKNFSQKEREQEASNKLLQIKVNNYLDRLLHKLKQETYIEIHL